MMSIVIGLVTIAIGIAGMAIEWWGGITGFQLFIKALVATVPALLVISGVIAVVAGISSLKDKAAEKSEKKEEPAKKEEPRKPEGENK